MQEANLPTETIESSDPILNLHPDTQLVTVDDPSSTVSVLWDRATQQAVIDTAPGPTIGSRAYSMVHTAMFDAWAAYDPEAIATQLGDDLQRPEAEITEANKTEAMSYAAYRVLVDLFPDRVAIFDELMTEMGFDPDNVTTDTTTAAGVGNVSAQALLEFRHQDGSNQLGDISYAPSDDYQYINEPGHTSYIEHWTSEYIPIDSTEADAPVQEFLTPHWGEVTPFALDSGEQFRPEAPQPFLLVDGEVDLENKTITIADTNEVLPISKDLIGEIINPEFITQAEKLVDVSGNLSDEQKLIAEFWEDPGGTSFPPGTWMTFGEFVSARDDNTVDEDAQMFFALGNAVFDAGIATWEAKKFYDYTRPVRAIRTLGELGLIGEYNPELGGYAIEAWNGSEQGTQTILASDFITYQTPGSHASPPFSEYTSGHSAFSAAGAEILESFTQSDDFGASVSFEPGESRFESGITPEEVVILEWPTFSEAADEAGVSRIYGGIHFDEGDLNGRHLGREVGETVWSEAQFYIQGGETETETAYNQIFGTDRDDVFDAADSRDRLTGNSDMIVAGAGDDLADVSLGSGNNRIYAQAGNDILIAGNSDRLLGGDGDDSLFVTNGGNNLMTGEAGEDVFWIVAGEFPDAANIIGDFEVGVDRLGVGSIANISSLEDLSFSQSDNNTIIAIEGQDIAIVQNIAVGELQESNNFIFA